MYCVTCVWHENSSVINLKISLYFLVDIFSYFFVLFVWYFDLDIWLFFEQAVHEEAFTYINGQKEFLQIDHDDLYPYLLVNIGSGVSMIKVFSLYWLLIYKLHISHPFEDLDWSLSFVYIGRWI